MLQQNSLFANRYQLRNLIGRGGFSEVWLAHDTWTDLDIAIKVYAPGQGLDSDGLKEFCQEIESVHHLTHPNLLKPDHVDQWESMPYLVMEYCPKGALNKRVGKLSEEQIWKVLHDVAAGLAYLHSKDIVHQDIKPDNILLDESGNYRITDFGISTKARTTLRKSMLGASTSGGTMAYMGPERFSKNSTPIKASDIWSLGATIYELIEGDVPFGEIGGGMQKNGADIPNIKANVSTKLKKMIYKMLDAEPWKRPTANQIVDEIDGKNTIVSHNVSHSIKGLSINHKVRKYGWVALLAVLLIGGIFCIDYCRTKVAYYKDYTEIYGVPVGIGKVSKSEMSHMNRVYRFESKNYLVRRVSHVNSKGNVISDSETERKERPEDMVLQYKHRKIHKIAVRDHNEKVLYIKAFNDEQNVITFQYDDEFGMEKVLGNNTIGSNSITDSDSKGRISRWLLEYNKDGYVERLWYAGSHNTKVPDADGIYGRQYSYDKFGHIIKEQYLTQDGSYRTTNWGLGQKCFEYSDNNLVRVSYQTIDGEASYDSNGGCSVYELEYDKYGNEIFSWYKDVTGELTIPSSYKLAGTKREYNSEGFLIKTTSLDTERKPYYSDGTVSTVMTYDEFGYPNTIEFLDEKDALTITQSGISKITLKHDARSNLLEMWNIGLDGQLIESSDGYAGCKYQYDSLGNETERIFYGANKEIIELKDGTVGRRFEYDNLNRIVKIINLGEKLTPAKDNSGVAIYAYEMDARGNYTKVSYYDVDGRKLVNNTENQIAGVKSVFDENGNLTERSFFDKDGNLCERHASEVYARVSFSYDKNGYLIRSRYYDKYGNLTVYDEDEKDVVGYDYKRDERGNAVEVVGVDKTGQLAKDELCIRRAFDENDNILETSFWDKDGNKTTNYDGVHKYINAYNNRNQRIEEKSLDKNNKLVLGKDSKYAIVRNAYDNYGRQVSCSYYGTDEKLCKNSYGFAVWKKEYNSLGQETRVVYTDSHGFPTKEDDHIPEYRYEYDKWGNWISSTTYDGYGNIIMAKDNGYAIYRSQYDIRGNLLWGAYYDTYNNPVKSKQTKYHKVTYSYNKYGSVTEEAYWGTTIEPISVDDVHKTITTYNSNGKIQEESYWGTKNEKVNNDYGYHRISIEYNEDGQQVHRIYYTASGMMFATQDWVAGEWTTKFNKRVQMQNYIDNSRRYLPNDYGEEYGNFTVRYFSIISDNCFGVYCSVPYANSSLSSEDLDYFRGLLKGLVENIFYDMPSGVHVKGFLRDSYSNQIATYYY